MSKLLFGIGVHEKGKYVATSYGVANPEYRLWKNMLNRCYGKPYVDKYPTYIGCTVSENFKNFQYFAEWCNKQKNFNKVGWDLDKDIIGNGKVYSEEGCRFVPQEINKLLIGQGKGQFKTGVHFSSKWGKFKAQCSCLGKRQALGYFSTEDEAFLAYKTFKESLIKERVQLWKEYLDEDVYHKLMTYTI